MCVFCRLGVLVEVNCETDFVARGDVFQTLAADVAMQLASNEQVEAVSKDDFPQENLAKEREIAMQMEDIQSKPENIRYTFLATFLTSLRCKASISTQDFLFCSGRVNSVLRAQHCCATEVPSVC